MPLVRVRRESDDQRLARRILDAQLHGLMPWWSGPTCSALVLVSAWDHSTVWRWARQVAGRS